MASIDELGADIDAALTLAVDGEAGDVTYADRIVTLVGAELALGDADIVAEFRINGVAIPGLNPTVNAKSTSDADRTITFPNIGAASTEVPASVTLTIVGAASQDGDPYPVEGFEVTVPFDLVQSTADDVGAALIAALIDAIPGSDGDDFDYTDNLLAIDGGLALGDATVTAFVIVNGTEIPALAPTVDTHEGMAADDLEVTLPDFGEAGTEVEVPKLFIAGRQ